MNGSDTTPRSCARSKPRKSIKNTDIECEYNRKYGSKKVTHTNTKTIESEIHYCPPPLPPSSEDDDDELSLLASLDSDDELDDSLNSEDEEEDDSLDCEEENELSLLASLDSEDELEDSLEEIDDSLDDVAEDAATTLAVYPSGSVKIGGS